MTRTRRQLLENFDDEVREKLKVSDEASRAYLNQYERLLIQLTRHELNRHAEFVDDSSFHLKTCPFAGDIPLGLYELPRRSGEAHLYRLNHPLADSVLSQAKNRDLAPVEIHFDYSEHEGIVSALEPLLGKTGSLSLSMFTVESLDHTEDHLVFAAVTDVGQVLDEEATNRLFSLPGKVGRDNLSAPLPDALSAITRQRQESIQRVISERNARFFEIEAEKLEGWSDDLKLGLEREIKELDRQIKEARRAATTALTLEEKLAGQKQIKALESQRSQKRRSLFDAQDDVDKRREEFILQIEGKLQQSVEIKTLFSIRWCLK